MGTHAGAIVTELALGIHGFLRKTLTVIIISYDLSVTRFADQIVVMHDGRIEGQGSLTDVLEQSTWLQTHIGDSDAICGGDGRGCSQYGQRC